MRKKPLVSVVTVVYNGEDYLEDCIESVVGQTYDAVEYIVVDGGSTDASVDIIKCYEDSIDQWISEPDKGVYDAMNKGIKRASGDIIGLVNADDYYNQDTAKIVAKVYAEKPQNIISGAMNRVMEDGSEYTIRRSLSQSYLENTIEYTMPVNHPATFVPAQVYKDLGVFDTSLQVLGDYDFICRAYKAGIPFTFVDRVLSNMRVGGLSSGTNNATRRAKERYAVRKKNGMTSASRNAMLSAQWLVSTLVKGGIKKIIPDSVQAQLYTKRHGEAEASLKEED
jgi:glycosyltransferase involved in cell wall biosynthesis